MKDFFQNIDWMLILRCFLVGGSICVIGQLLIDKTKLTPARILVVFVTTGAILGGLRNIPISSRFCWCWCYGSLNRLWKCTSKRCNKSHSRKRSFRHFYRWNNSLQWWNCSSNIFWIYRCFSFKA